MSPSHQRPRTLQIGLCLAVFTLLTTRAAIPLAPPPPSVPTSFELTAIDRWLAAESRQPGRLGLSVAIARQGEIVFAQAYGTRTADASHPDPVAPETLFPIGSVSKQFTCAAILLLADDGLLRVHDHVSKFYPNCTRADDITLLDLMNHVSGYPDYYPLDFLDRRLQGPIRPDDPLQRYAGGALDFDPGTRFSYSNTGYILLGRVVEQVTGKPLGQFLRERIFEPLGMSRTVYEPVSADPHLARGHTTFALGEPQPVAPEGPGWLGGAGAMASTPSDLLRWDLAVADGRLLSPESWRLFAAARVLADGRVSQYGCGVGLRLQNGRPLLSHNGAVSGFNAYNVVIPSTRSALAVVCNVEGGYGDVPDKLLALLLDEPSGIPSVQGPPPADMARQLFLALQAGRLDRSRFGAEFNHFLTDEKVAAAARRLKSLGRPTQVELVSRRERGGLEVSVARLSFRKAKLRTLMYRQPDGRVEQFFVNRE